MDISYSVTGGNTNYSTNFLSKFSTGSEMCFYFGSVLEGQRRNSCCCRCFNLFIQKHAFDVVCKSLTGYLDAIDGLPLNQMMMKSNGEIQMEPNYQMNRISYLW